MNKIISKPESIIGITGYCPGCGHGVIQRLIAESIEELGIQDNIINVVDIACSYWSMDTMNFDSIAGPHGRCAAVATGIKKVRPKTNVYVHAGDGSSYVIGLSETIFTALRDVPITMIVVNNGIFGMTGGQLNLATTPLGDKTVSSPYGRNSENYGSPINMMEVLKNYDVEFLARGALFNGKEINKTKRYIKQGFKNQINNKGFSLIEILSNCPTNWKLSPIEAADKVKEVYTKIFPLGVYKDRGEKNE
ncbi:keto:oxoacid ferredoxin oxidoreductase [Peptoniphilus sp. AGMB00490]|uniref:Keto:oxoacid ferredoxin oxidoreductase n=1 Tax=Peptoniphilus faecalis TaxID=2731255 RepID=A0A848RKP8_9FIRM|nr:thiamine pyrophosphate-dependent enzyme [Peptoniphilus faecalis]NMW85746.1 keto:oxoacid ferredoxin oxidoreductase [Peptoniphilus faecalis]